MDRCRKDELIVLSVPVVEMVSPDVFHIPRVHPSVAVRHFRDKSHGRQIVQIPTRRDLDESCLRAPDEWLHPGRCGLGVVYGGDSIACAQVVRKAVMVREIVFFAKFGRSVKNGLLREFSNLRSFLHTVLYPIPQCQLHSVLARLPERSHCSSRRSATKFSKLFVRVIENIVLLLNR